MFEMSAAAMVIIIVILFIFRRLTKKMINTAETVLDKGVNMIDDSLHTAETAVLNYNAETQASLLEAREAILQRLQNATANSASNDDLRKLLRS